MAWNASLPNAGFVVVTDIRSIAEQIVSTWPKLTTEQQAAIGSVIGASDAR